ncbi:hypothetical protein DPMN_152943 [Dreissena polymorpha]|uniref:Uncharacterized protein n=1 Tax=Dreissena polymorpha TaxID=45954 RepID=A0A9D4FJU5_DREPO|nr:hypothetical protein DPMN_152943 [Dreissena polymorpha]
MYKIATGHKQECTRLTTRRVQGTSRRLPDSLRRCQDRLDTCSLLPASRRSFHRQTVWESPAGAPTVWETVFRYQDGLAVLTSSPIV